MPPPPFEGGGGLVLNICEGRCGIKRKEMRAIYNCLQTSFHGNSWWENSTCVPRAPERDLETGSRRECDEHESVSLIHLPPMDGGGHN